MPRWQRPDSNRRSPGHEPGEITNFSTLQERPPESNRAGSSACPQCHQVQPALAAGKKPGLGWQAENQPGQNACDRALSQAGFKTGQEASFHASDHESSVFSLGLSLRHGTKKPCRMGRAGLMRHGQFGRKSWGATCRTEMLSGLARLITRDCAAERGGCYTPTFWQFRATKNLVEF